MSTYVLNAGLLMSTEFGQDLRCQKCPATYMWRQGDRTTEYAARFDDWKVFSGPTESGGHTDVVLCPKCGGNVVRKRVDKFEPLAGQQLFDI